MDIGFDRGFFLPLRRQEPPPSAEGVWHGIWISRDDITPANAGDLKKTLNSEAAHPKYWITLAFCYRGVGEVELFEHFLKEADARLDGAGKGEFTSYSHHSKHRRNGRLPCSCLLCPGNAQFHAGRAVCPSREAPRSPYRPRKPLYLS